MSETMRGDGKIFKGQQFIADVQYDLRIQSNFRRTDSLTSSGMIQGLSDVHLRINPAKAVTPYFGDLLTLQMSDGRKQDFFVSTSDGDCKATGGPH
jgi:hypothetical protein